MAESETGQERTEEPTPKKLDDARKKGQIARSRDFNTMVIIALAATTFLMLGHIMIADISGLMTQYFQPSRADMFDPLGVIRWFYGATLDAVWLLVPYLALMLVGAMFAPIMIGGVRHNANPKATRNDFLNFNSANPAACSEANPYTAIMILRLLLINSQISPQTDLSEALSTEIYQFQSHSPPFQIQ